MAEICLFKFNDLDGDGVRDLNEPGLGGWQFNVSPAPLPPATSPVTTLPSGGICFGVSAPGTYTITEIVQSGWTPTTPNTQTVTVPPSPVNVFFGNKKKEEGKCDLTIGKSLAHGIIPPLQTGQQAIFEIIVTNKGNGTCNAPISVTDSFSAGLTYVSGGTSGWICPTTPLVGPNTVTCTNNQPLAPGNSSLLLVTFNVTAPPPAKVGDCATVKNANDTNLANNRACIEVPVRPCKDVTMNLSTGVANWTVSPGTAGVTTPVSTWVQPSGGVQWIQPSTAGSPQDFPAGPAGNYQYSVLFTLGPLAQYATITLSGKYAADNSVISVSPPPVGPLCSPPNNNCFSAWYPLSITSGFQAGNNTLDVTVYNNPYQGGPTKTGLVVDATLRAVCKK